MKISELLENIKLVEASNVSAQLGHIREVKLLMNFVHAKFRIPANATVEEIGDNYAPSIHNAANRHHSWDVATLTHCRNGWHIAVSRRISIANDRDFYIINGTTKIVNVPDGEPIPTDKIGKYIGYGEMYVIKATMAPIAYRSKETPNAFNDNLEATRNFLWSKGFANRIGSNLAIQAKRAKKPMLASLIRDLWKMQKDVRIGTNVMALGAHFLDLKERDYNPIAAIDGANNAEPEDFMTMFDGAVFKVADKLKDEYKLESPNTKLTPAYMQEVIKGVNEIFVNLFFREIPDVEYQEYEE